jgi:hypothetical protein
VVTISTATPSATIYYTTNGVTPTTNSTVYTGPITVSASELLEAIAVSTTGGLKAVATVSGGTVSLVSSAAYTITPPTALPTFSPAAGTYFSAQTVAISSTTPSATIFYTTNGSTPTITVGATETLKAIAVATGDSASTVNSAAYTITPAPVMPVVPPTAPPTFSPTGGTYSSAQTVTISSTTPSATIYYTTDGRSPTTASPVYAGPITIGANETLKAFAVVADSADGMLQDRKATREAASSVSSAAYIITPTTEVATSKPAAGGKR